MSWDTTGLFWDEWDMVGHVAGMLQLQVLERKDSTNYVYPLRMGNI